MTRRARGWRWVRGLVYVMVIVGGVVALLGLFVLSWAADPHMQGQARQHLGHLLEHDARADLQVLMARNQLHQSYDALTATCRTIDHEVDHLQRHAVFEGIDLRIGLLVVVARLHEKRRMIEAFKSQNAALHNSLRYFPTAIDNALASALELEVRYDIARLMRLVLVYAHTRAPGVRIEALGLVDHLGSGLAGEEVRIALAHAVRIVGGILTVDAQVEGLLSTDSGGALLALDHTIARRVLYRLKWANGFRYQLFFVALFFMVYTGRLLWRLRRTTTVLSDTVRVLDVGKGLYRALSATNHGVMHLKSPEVLFEEVCRILVELGGMHRAWIGRVDGEVVVPLALSGATATLAPIAMAETGCVMDTMLAESYVVMDEVKGSVPFGAGVKSVVALPLLRSGHRCGVLVVYADSPGFFSLEYLHLLQKVVESVNFALDNFDRLRAAAAAEAELRLAATAFNSHEAITITDLQGTILRTNPAFSRITGYTEAEAVGNNPRVLKSGRHDDAFYADMWARLTGLGRWEGEIWNQRKNGEIYPEWLSITAVHNEAGEATNYVAHFHDLSDIMQNEQALRRANEKAMAASRAKSYFLAAMSHEIRTPLNGVLGMAEVLGDTALDATQRDHLDTLTHSGRALLFVINDILDISKIEAGRLELVELPLDLRELTHGTCDQLRMLAEDKGITLSVVYPSRTPRVLMGDEGRLGQVLLNLVGNAIKFTAEGGVVVRVIDVGSSGASARLRISVEDTGIGLDEGDQARLFKPFSQADASISRRFGGTGLGLAISRQLVELMGGELGVDSVLGQGSNFWFELELPSLPGQGMHSGERPQLSMRFEGRVLLAEDNLVNRKVAVAALSRLGLSVEVARDGQEAFDAWADGAFDLVLMDCQMPEVDGLQATQMIRAREAGGRVPIIALTANAMADDRVRCLEAGMDDFISKPFTRVGLSTVLARWLRTRGVSEA